MIDDLQSSSLCWFGTTFRKSYLNCYCTSEQLHLQLGKMLTSVVPEDHWKAREPMFLMKFRRNYYFIQLYRCAKKKQKNTKTNEYHKPHALPELLQGNSIQFYNSEPSNVLFFLLSRKSGLWCIVCRCVYPGVCICLCIHSCLINLLLRFNSHWIIYMFQRRLNSEDFHGANTLNLRVGFDFLLLCKQFKAVKHTLELTNASPETCHVVTDVSTCQPDRRYPFQPRTVYTYHLPQPIFFSQSVGQTWIPSNLQSDFYRDGSLWVSVPQQNISLRKEEPMSWPSDLPRGLRTALDLLCTPSEQTAEKFW